MKTIWQKKEEQQTAYWFWDFTTREDRIFDQKLIPFEILSNLAHIQILKANELITEEEYASFRKELLSLWQQQNHLQLSEDDEDVHSFIEKHLTKTLGELGKRIHTMRSRNDLILADTRMWGKEKLNELAEKLQQIIALLLEKAQQEKIWFPGLTHTQLAMPQCSDTFYTGYAELLLQVSGGLNWAIQRLDVLPMGSAAGYGTPFFDVKTELYAELLGFSNPFSSVSYNQLSRGLEEQAGLSIVDEAMQVINRLAADFIFMISDVNGWLVADESQVSGSSIMPQKKNPDAWELIRSETHRFSGTLAELRAITSNLSSGYHRDLQRIKHLFMSSVMQASYLFEVVEKALKGVSFHPEKCKFALKPELFATHLANKLSKDGTPFREAYKIAAQTYKDVQFTTEDLEESYLYSGTPGKANIKKVQANLSKFEKEIQERKKSWQKVVDKLVQK